MAQVHFRARVRATFQHAELPALILQYPADDQGKIRKTNQPVYDEMYVADIWI